MVTEQQKERRKQYDKKYYQTHPEYRERQKELHRKWYQTHKERIKEYNKKYKETHKEQIREYHRKYDQDHKEQDKKLYVDLRMRVFEKLGNKCSNPFNLPHPDWCNDPRVLQIDHVHGGGVREQKKLGTMMKYLKKVLTDTEDNYQLLCANCNWIKKYEKREVANRCE